MWEFFFCPPLIYNEIAASSLYFRQLAKVRGYIGESTTDFRQLVKLHRMYWRKYSGFSPIGEIPLGVLARVQWIFANGESPIGESLIGEILEPHKT